MRILNYLKKWNKWNLQKCPRLFFSREIELWPLFDFAGYTMQTPKIKWCMIGAPTLAIMCFYWSVPYNISVYGEASNWSHHGQKN